MYKVINRQKNLFGQEEYTNEFVVDSESEISTLPTSTVEGTGGKTDFDNKTCGAGSIAYVIQANAASKYYMLNTSDQWVAQSGEGNGETGEDSGGNNAGETTWSQYALNGIGGSVEIDNATENFPSGTYLVKADDYEADSTWTFQSGTSFENRIWFSNGMEHVSVTYQYISGPPNSPPDLDRLTFTADMPVSTLYFAKID